MGGLDCESNLIELTAREHFVCHQLLTKMVSDQQVLAKLAYAAWQQTRSSKYRKVHVTSLVYSKLKKLLSDSSKGLKRGPMSEQAKQNMRQAAATRKKSPISDKRILHLKNQAAKRKGMPLSADHKQKCSESLKGRTFSPEHRDKIRSSKIGISRPLEVIEKIKTTKRLNPTPNPMQGKKHSESSKEKMRAAKKGRHYPHKMKPIECVSTGETFDSIKSASIKYNISSACISAVLKGIQKSTKGLIFKYIIP